MLGAKSKEPTERWLSNHQGQHYFLELDKPQSASVAPYSIHKDELPNSSLHSVFWAPGTEFPGSIATRRGVQATAALAIHELVAVVTALRNNPPITIAPDLRLRAASTDALVP
eukprot:CAMPEP_0115223872 /NCGR_PEP_ID=MMETSP0270-20121206/29270_1 /TAXON_ID=71861 /ORGANISM="Scrippsiella trochoidea, Strain CCMP3099" /LENGTH=112 /DNA_ID=CAMNT_0002638139 /DNA_START=236 /DNA_END=571 /DNA_ORIENTATION=+